MLQCLDKSKIDLILRGTYAAFQYNYIDIYLKLCVEEQPNGEPCASWEEIEEFFSDYTVQMPFVNSLANVKEVGKGNVNVQNIIDDRAYINMNLNN